jgi:hypothetical protein
VEVEADQLFETDAVLRLAALLPDDQMAAAGWRSGCGCPIRSGTGSWRRCRRRPC